MSSMSGSKLVGIMAIAVLTKTCVSIRMDLDTEPFDIRSYDIGQKLGGGSFGDVHECTGLGDKDYVVKIAPNGNKAAARQLQNEHKIYQAANNAEVEGIPKMHGYYQTRNNSHLVLDRLGQSLEDVKNRSRGGTMTWDKVCNYAVQMITLIESVHQLGYVYRDAKPDNFVTALEDQDKLNIIDFGLSIDKDKDLHEMAGTLRYVSRASHGASARQHFVDDLESIGYVLFYLLRERMPWSGYKCSNNIELSRAVGAHKAKWFFQLCNDGQNLPKEHRLPEDQFPEDGEVRDAFRKYFKFVRELPASNDIDPEAYDQLRKCFTSSELEAELEPVDSQSPTASGSDQLTSSRASDHVQSQGSGATSHASVVTSPSGEHNGGRVSERDSLAGSDASKQVAGPENVGRPTKWARFWRKFRSFFCWCF